MHTVPLRDWFQSLEESNTGNPENCLTASLIETPLGNMLAVGNERELFLLQFVDKQELPHEVIRLEKMTKSIIRKGSASAILSIKNELDAYFRGEIRTFKTRLRFLGSAFQQKAWHALCKIPYGKTKSYAEQAGIMGNPLACRAVGNANGANPLAIVVPCHRVIASTGGIGGYSSGIHRKKWLLKHESQWCHENR